MAFKTIKQYNEEKYGGKFRLVNDGDSADVIFLYRSDADVLIGDMHYIKSADYSGYVHCCGRGCPACGKGIRVQTKLFIPIYNITDNEIQFWDRNNTFETQLANDVFKNYPNPCNYVFKIIRHGEANNIETRYEIQVIGKNSQESYEQILARFGIKMPDHYETVTRELDASALADMIANPATGNDSGELPDYSVTPRSVVTSGSMVPPVYEPVPEDTMLPDAGDTMLPDEGLEDPSMEELDEGPAF